MFGWATVSADLAALKNEPNVGDAANAAGLTFDVGEYVTLDDGSLAHYAVITDPATGNTTGEWVAGFRPDVAVWEVIGIKKLMQTPGYSFELDGVRYTAKDKKGGGFIDISAFDLDGTPNAGQGRISSRRRPSTPSWAERLSRCRSGMTCSPSSSRRPTTPRTRRWFPVRMRLRSHGLHSPTPTTGTSPWPNGGAKVRPGWDGAAWDIRSRTARTLPSRPQRTRASPVRPFPVPFR